MIETVKKFQFLLSAGIYCMAACYTYSRKTLGTVMLEIHTMHKIQ